jgi:hypothetical protein
VEPTDGGWRAPSVATTLMAPSFSRYLVCALLAIAMVPAAAHAATAAVPVPASEALTTSAHALAVARWGVEPCGGQVAVTWAHMGAGVNARSQWMSVDVHDPSTYSQCSITYNLDIDWDWPKLCTVIEHELGHLAGHDHVDDPHNVMSPYYVFPTPECAAGQLGVAAAPAPVAVAPTSAAAIPGHATSKRKVVKRRPVKRRVARRKAVKRRVGPRNPAAKTAQHSGLSVQLHVIGIPASSVADPAGPFAADVLALAALG